MVRGRPWWWVAPVRAFLAAAAVLVGIALLAEAPLPSSVAVGEGEVAEGDLAATEDEAYGEFLEHWEERSLAIENEVEEETAGAEDEAAQWLEYRIRRGDTMEAALRAINADDGLRAYMVERKLKSHRRLRRGDTLYFRLDKDGRVVELLYKTAPEYYLTAGVDDEGNYWAREDPPEARTVRHYRGGTLGDSAPYNTLDAVAGAVGMSSAARYKLIAVLETQIDFFREPRPGDEFRVVYEEKRDVHGDLLETGRILAFEYDSRHERNARVIVGAYFDDEKLGGYYRPDGESLQPAFLPAPLKFRRVSSRFTNRRFHPILKRWRPHRGVDYAARSGTPVYATADGVVSLVQKQRGYGRVVMIKHYNDLYTTLYAHLRAFAKGMRRGRRVRQGEVIGYVGQSGLSTGPHLHYEFRVRGKHRDPLSVSVPKQKPPLTAEALAQFRRDSEALFAGLDSVAPKAVS